MNQNSGGWRYGNGGSNQFLYRNENVDNDLLKRAAEVAAPKGLLDTKIEAAPLDKFLQQDSENRGGDGFGGNQGATSTSSKASDGWGMNKYGVDVGFNPTNAVKGFGLLGPLGALAGLQPTKDPLGQFAYQSLVAQEQRDAMQAAKDMQAYAAIDSNSPAGGGWSSLSPGVQASIAAAADPIGAFADSIGMGGGGYGGGGGTNADGGTGDTGSDGVGGGGASGDSRGSDGANADGNFYKGGMVTPNRLAGPNPRGPDDGYAALDHGEYVIKASAVKKYGKGLLDAINTEKFKG